MTYGVDVSLCYMCYFLTLITTMADIAIAMRQGDMYGPARVGRLGCNAVWFKLLEDNKKLRPNTNMLKTEG